MSEWQGAEPVLQYLSITDLYQNQSKLLKKKVVCEIILYLFGLEG